jgi:hypothetical protein
MFFINIVVPLNDQILILAHIAYQPKPLIKRT